MSYLVLARKYRPQTFADVVGQDVIVKTLKTALTSGRVAHSFLFTGSRGTGKTTVARLLAKALVCQKGISDSPCGKCPHCQEVTQGTSIDVVEIDGASNTSVDDVRSLRENIRYQPSSCRLKIFIIDEVHMLSNSAFNALLKTLEEPPPHVKFIFATTESHKIPVTILSRCQRYDFKQLEVETIVSCLEEILKKEKITIDPDGLSMIAKSAEGGMRDALSLTDQVLSFSPKKASAAEVSEILGLFDRQLVLKAAHALVDQDAKTALELVGEAAQNGFDITQLASKVATELRHLAIASSLGTVQGCAELSQSETQAVDEKAKTLDAADMQRLFAMAVNGLDQMAKSQRPFMMLELLFLRMATRPNMAEASTISHAIARLENLAQFSKGAKNAAGTFQQKAAFAVPATASPTNIPPTPSAAKSPEPAVEQKTKKPLPVESVKPPSGIPQSIDLKWKNCVDLVIQSMPTLGHHLERAKFLGEDTCEGRMVLKLSFDQKFHYQSVLAEKNNPNLLALLEQRFQTGARLDLKLIGEEKTDSTRTTGGLSITEAKHIAVKKTQEALEQQAREDPMVKKALAIFGGEIRAVKRKDSSVKGAN